METLQALALLSMDELISRAATAPRQLSLCMTQLVHAKQAAMLGDARAKAQHVEAAKRCYLRAQEDERGQLARVAHVQAVVEEKGAALDATKGKHVVKVRSENGVAVWQEGWAR